VFHSDDVIASIDSYAERKLDREILTGILTDQHWEIIADLRHGRLSLSKPHPDTVAPPRKRRTAVTIALSRRRPRHSRVTILAAVFAVSSWTAAGLTFGTELGLAPDLAVVSSKRLQTSEPAPRPIEDPLPEACVDEFVPLDEPVDDFVEAAMDPPPAPVVRERARRMAPVPPPEPRREPARPESPPVREEVLPREPPPVEIAVGQLVELDEVDLIPRVTRWDLPTYTKRAKQRKQQGRVGLDLLIDEHGRIVRLQLRETTPHSNLNDVVVETVWGWRFAPARKSGVPVSVWKPVTIDFSIVSGRSHVQLIE